MAESAENFTLPPMTPPANHGHTVAAWFTMTAVMVGAALGGIGLVVATSWVVALGGIVAIVGLVGGAVLRAMGFGQEAVRR